MSTELRSVILENGKYLMVFREGNLEAYRYGDYWRSLNGDKLVYLMYERIIELEDKLKKSDLKLEVAEEVIDGCRCGEGGDYFSMLEKRGIK